MPYPFKNQFIATNPKSQHLDIPDFIIGRQNYMKLKYKKKERLCHIDGNGLRRFLNGDVETRFDTSNREINRILPTGKCKCT